MNSPLAGAYDDRRFVRSRIYSNWAIIAGSPGASLRVFSGDFSLRAADILAIVLITIGMAVILSHPLGFSAIGVTLAVIGNSMFYVSYVPLVSGRYALFKQDLEQESSPNSLQGAPNQGSTENGAPSLDERAPLV